MKILLMTSLFLISTAHAQSGQISTATSPEVQKETVHQENGDQRQKNRPFVEGNSSENREHLKWQFTLGPGIEFGIPNFNYTLGHFLKSHALLTVRFLERHDYTGDTGRKGITALKVGYKKFTGNSFFYQPSLYFRNASHTTSVKYKYEDVGVGLRIGNEWQWENFTLGIDWLGINHKVVKLSEETRPAGPVPSSIDIDKDFTYDFVGLYLGYAF